MTDLRTIKRLLLVAIILLVLGIVSAAASGAMAQDVDGGGGGQCRPQFWYLNGCEHRVRCDIGRPVFPLTPDEDGWFNGFCYHDPQKPAGGGVPLVELAPGEVVELGCETALYADGDGVHRLLVGCQE